MTGLLTAARLADSGLDVLVVDAGPIGGRNTVMSTGNLYAPVSRLAELVSRWGGDTASRIVQWRQQALRAIETLVHRYDLRCGFERVAMQYGMQERTREVTTRFERELHAYQRVGLQCEHQQSGLPFALGHAFRVPDQAQLDPAAFCRSWRDTWWGGCASTTGPRSTASRHQQALPPPLAAASMPGTSCSPPTRQQGSTWCRPRWRCTASTAWRCRLPIRQRQVFIGSPIGSARCAGARY